MCCQSFGFKRPGVATLREQLIEIAETKGKTVEAEALTVIAREGRGSFRDAEITLGLSVNVYDALFLALAEDSGVVLVTAADGRLLKALEGTSACA